MFCSKCKEKIIEESIFCPYCGERIEGRAETDDEDLKKLLIGLIILICILIVSVFVSVIIIRNLN